MRLAIITILLLVSLGSAAQVKEINSLGKKWYLHGYDFRIKGRLYTPSFYTSLFQNAEFPSVEYKGQFNFTQFHPKRDFLRATNTISAGVVFRPFFQSPIKFIRQVEFAHNIEIERIKVGFHNFTQNDFSTNYNTNSIFIKSLDLGYNPRLILSSPTLAESLKLYLAADGYGFIPISGTVYTTPDRSFLPNGSKSYSIAGDFFKDKISTNHFKYGGGISAGVKVNLSCNWNFHLEYSTFDVYTRHGYTKSVSQSGNRGVQFGLRYKFGSAEESEADTSNKTPVFW